MVGVKSLRAGLSRCVLAAASLWFMHSVAVADTTISYAVQNGGEMRMAMTSSHLRIETGQGQWMLYDSSADTMYMVQPEIRQYAVMDRATIAAIGVQANAAMAEMEQAMAGMGAEEKAMMQKMMGGHFQLPNGKKEKPKASVTETGKREKVAGYSCAVKEYRPNNGGKTEICVADIKSLGVTKAEYDVALKMSALMLELAESMPFGSSQNVQDMSQLKGIPILSKDESGQDMQRITAVSHAKISADKFELPAGYTPQSM